MKTRKTRIEKWIEDDRVEVTYEVDEEKEEQGHNLVQEAWKEIKRRTLTEKETKERWERRHKELFGE